MRCGAGGPGRPRREATPGAARLGLAPVEASASADAVARIRDVDKTTAMRFGQRSGKLSDFFLN